MYIFYFPIHSFFCTANSVHFCTKEKMKHMSLTNPKVKQYNVHFRMHTTYIFLFSYRK